MKDDYRSKSKTGKQKKTLSIFFFYGWVSNCTNTERLYGDFQALLVEEYLGGPPYIISGWEAE